MRVLRAIMTGILLWILVFVEISIFQIGLQLEFFGKVIHYLLLIPISVLCASIYYKSGDHLNGFFLGIFIVVVGTILDLLITVPLFMESNYAQFYSDIFLWIGFVVAVVVVGTYDKARRK